MKKLSYVVLALSCFSLSAFAEVVPNLNTAKKAVIRYHDSGAYEKDIALMISGAKDYLKTELTKSDIKKPAIVLDIDETSLSNYPNMVKASFGGTLEQMHAAERQGKDPVIKPTLELYRFAKENGVSVFFVTGRPEDERKPTVANLENSGFKNWDDLVFKPAKYQGKSAAVYKTAVRKSLTEKGYTILLNIGDQESDLKGGYAQKTVKLPNPYYVIP